MKYVASENFKKLQHGFFLFLLLGNLLLAFLILKPFLSPLVVAITFAVIFYPLYRAVKASVIYESLAAFITTILVLLIVLLPLVFFGVQIFQEARDLYTQLSLTTDFADRLPRGAQEQVENLVPQLTLNIGMYVRQILNWLLQNAGSAFSGLAQIGISIFITVLAMYYLFKDGPRLRQALFRLSPLLDTYDTKISERLHTAVTSVIRGTLVIAIIQGIACAIGFIIFGVPHAALWGSVAVLAALVPNIGTALVLLPAILFLLLTEHMVASIGLLVWGVAVVGLIDNLLRPKLIERDLHIHPLLILLAVLGGLAFFGPVGFLLGPLTLSLLFALLDIYQVLIVGENSTQST